MKKAFAWLDRHHILYEFHDYKKSGISKAKLDEWCRQQGWETILNKKGSTWRLLEEDLKTSITGRKNAVALLQEHTSMIRRPVIEQGGKVLAVGFDETRFNQVFKENNG